MTHINSDFTKRAVVHSARIPWVASPIAGVDRRMLDRIGDEVARATSIVRYAPKCHFTAHIHSGGEEFLVLDGVFQDEHGDFHAGSYIRNPPTSCHTPGSETGCTIFVKLWQFDPTDRNHVRIDTSKLAFTPAPGRKGVETMALFADSNENVRLERWAPGAAINLDLKGGGEFLVLEGSFDEGSDHLETESWLRLPVDGCLRATAGKDGCKLWVKTGHLSSTLTTPVRPTQ
jgi:anti-sigma factor ChrR (cupin superfamily)